MNTFENTQNNIYTFSDAEQSSMGEFLIGELEKLDQKRYGPMYNPTYKRDIDFRTDVQLIDTASSFVKYYFRASNGNNGQQVAAQNPASNTAPEVNFEYTKYTQPLYMIQRAVSYNFIELKRSIALGRPIDSALYDALMLAHDMEMERLVYIGDKTKNTTGLLNNADAITKEVSLNAKWSDPTTTPDAIVKDVNDMFSVAWKNTNYNILPKRMLMSPTLYSTLVSRKVSEAGNVSILNYVKENSIVRNTLGIDPEIYPLKWLEDKIPDAITNRIVVYEKREDFIRLPYVPLQRITPIELFNSGYKANYHALYGGMEVVYPETLNYFKVKTA